LPRRSSGGCRLARRAAAGPDAARGAHFDSEGFQIVGDKIGIGEEIGPYVLRTDMNARR
jgi:hypothetical protein